MCVCGGGGAEGLDRLTKTVRHPPLICVFAAPCTQVDTLVADASEPGAKRGSVAGLADRSSFRRIAANLQAQVRTRQRAERCWFWLRLGVSCVRPPALPARPVHALLTCRLHPHPL